MIPVGSSGEALEAFVAQQVGTATEPDLDQFVGQWVGSVEAFISGFLGSVEADWKPSLHPRGPDGKFIDSLAGLGISDLIDEHGLDSLDSVSNVVRGGAKSDVDLGELGDRIAEERSGGYIARAVKEAAEAEEIDVDGFDANARLVYTHDAKEFPQEAQERFAESVDQGELETVEESVGKWELDFFAENMAPMWQAAMEDTGNPNLLNDEERVSDVDVPDADLDAIRKQKEHAVETMREIHGDTVTVYRAFQGDAGQKLEDAAEAGESIDMDRRALESYTTELSYAKGYVRGQRGAVIKREIDVEQIWASSDAGFLSAVENEVVVGHDSVETIEPDDILTHADLDDGATNVELIGNQIRDIGGDGGDGSGNPVSQAVSDMPSDAISDADSAAEAAERFHDSVAERHDPDVVGELDPDPGGNQDMPFTKVMGKWNRLGYWFGGTKPLWDGAAEQVDREDAEIHPEVERDAGKDFISWKEGVQDVASDLSEASKEYFSQNVAGDDGTADVHRGITGDLAEEIAHDRITGGDPELNPRVMESYSTSREVAYDYYDQEGILLTQNIERDDVAYLPALGTPGMHSASEVTVLGHEKVSVDTETAQFSPFIVEKVVSQMDDPPDAETISERTGIHVEIMEQQWAKPNREKVGL